MNQIKLIKSEFKNDQLNGFSLFYKKTIIRAEKYSMGIKIKNGIH
jgi:hypothetical protein